MIHGQTTLCEHMLWGTLLHCHQCHNDANSPPPFQSQHTGLPHDNADRTPSDKDVLTARWRGGRGPAGLLTARLRGTICLFSEVCLCLGTAKPLGQSPICVLILLSTRSAYVSLPSRGEMATARFAAWWYSPSLHTLRFTSLWQIISYSQAIDNYMICKSQEQISSPCCNFD